VRGVLTVVTPRGVYRYSTGTTQTVLDLAPPGACLVLSCGWHITCDGQDVHSRRVSWHVTVVRRDAWVVANTISTEEEKLDEHGTYR
jgi:hypothetical protein